MRKTLLASAIGIAFAFNAQAADESDYLLKTASDLADLCSATQDPSAIHMCHGYLVGVHQMYVGISQIHSTDIYCVPEDATMSRDQFVAEFVTWVGGNAEAQTMTARRGLLTFAAQTFPCS